MPKPPAFPTESHLSREDVELLAGLKGGQDALLVQVNTLQLSVQQEAEARRKQQEDQRQDHNEQMNVIQTQMETLETWKVTMVTPERIQRWDDTAIDVYNFKQRWKGVASLWAVILAIATLFLGWFLNTFITPIF